MRTFGLVLAASLVVVACNGRIPTQVLAPANGSATATAVPTPMMPASAPATIQPTGPPKPGTADPSVAQLIGQKLVVSMTGTRPSADLLGRVRRGEVGGVILFGSNVTTPTALTALTRRLRGAAAAGGQPPLLIATDQEGGSVRRVPWAGPTVAPIRMGDQGSASIARSEGADTGAALRDLGINVDLAPVADVPASAASFMYLDGRTWSFSATATSRLANAFASGLESRGVVPVMKHFPGLGFATQNTDSHVVTLTESIAALAPGLSLYRTAIGDRIPMIMLSNATYTVYDRLHAAGWSRAIATTLLRRDLGFTGVTITDSLTGAAAVRGVSPGQLAVRAATAGTDMILVTGSEDSTRAVYATLLAAADDGAIPAATLRASYARILALKAGL